MTYFKNIKSLEDLKEQFKKLAKVNHPDAGGNAETMKEINVEYDELFPIWKHRYNATAEVKTEETASGTRSRFYTENGWAGKNYQCGQDIADIAKNIRSYCKEIYPAYKFSVSISRYSGGCSMSVYLMEAPHQVFTDETIKDIQINQFYINNDTRMNELTKAIFTDINNQINSYRYDDSDSQIDYFSTNFYYDLGIGYYKRPFKVVEKTARIKDTQTTAPAPQPEATEPIISDEYDIQESTHTKTGSKIWLVKIKRTLSRDEYLKEATKMDALDGYYSKFTHSFVFNYNPTDKLTA
jgi:curved DNA-binding protein CbpA